MAVANCSLFTFTFYLPLPDGLEHEDGGRNADVQGVEPAEHGDADMGIGSLAPLLGESCGFRSHHDGGRACHVVVVILVRVLKLGGEDVDFPFLEEGDALLRGTDDRWYREYSPDTGPNQVGVIEVCQRVADDHGIHVGGIGTAQDGPQIAGLLHTLENDD